MGGKKSDLLIVFGAGDENILELVVIVAQLCEYTNNYKLYT